MEYSMSSDTVPSLPKPELVRFASGFWRRFWAFFIDAWICIIGVYLVKHLFGLSFFPPQHSHREPYLTPLALHDLAQGIIALLFDLIVAWLYWSLLECSRFQATLGKMALGIIVTDEYGRRISFGRATGREFSKTISAFFFIGFIMAAFTKTNQALHDKIAGTLVLLKNKKDFILR